MNNSIIDNVMHSTILIEVVDDHDITTSTGTGFVYNFCTNKENNTCIPAIVTNKHVINGSKRIKITFTLADNNGNPLYRNQHRFFIELKSIRLIYHPSDFVDLVIFPIAPILNILDLQKVKAYYVSLNSDLIPSNDEWENFTALEEIIMVGYPNGIWDKLNNLPILRRGITASHPSFDFNSKKEFLIDAACFPGSSGSPVLLYNTGSYYNKKTNSMNLGSRLKLLGILYSGPIHYVSGVATNNNADLISGKQTITPVMINIGHVIKSTVLNDFEKLLK